MGVTNYLHVPIVLKPEPSGTLWACPGLNCFTPTCTVDQLIERSLQTHYHVPLQGSTGCCTLLRAENFAMKALCGGGISEVAFVPQRTAGRLFDGCASSPWLTCLFIGDKCVLLTDCCAAPVLRHGSSSLLLRCVR